MGISRRNSSKSSTKQSRATPEETRRKIEELKLQLETLTRTLDNLKECHEVDCSAEENKDPSIEPGGSTTNQKTPIVNTPHESKPKISSGSHTIPLTQSMLKCIKQLQEFDKIKRKREKEFHKKCLSLNKKLLEFENEASIKDRLNAELEEDIQNAKLNIEKRIRSLHNHKQRNSKYKLHKAITLGSYNKALDSAKSELLPDSKDSEPKNKSKIWKRLKNLMYKKPRDCVCVGKCSNTTFQSLFSKCNCALAVEKPPHTSSIPLEKQLSIQL